MSDHEHLTEQEASEHIAEGLRIGRAMVDEMILPLLGESPDAWYGAGVMASWIHDVLADVAHEPGGILDEVSVQQCLLAVAVQVRAIRDHPLALAALKQRQEKEA